MGSQGESVLVGSSAFVWARRVVVTAFVLAFVAFAIPPVHDAVIESQENSASEAYWKWLYWGDRGLPDGWHRSATRASGNLDAWARNVTAVGDGVYMVDGSVERVDERGEREFRRCTWQLWRECYDVWHRTRISIQGELPIELDDVDGPTGKDVSLWCNRIERALAQYGSAP